jgi:hypothetical protein
VNAINRGAGYSGEIVDQVREVFRIAEEEKPLLRQQCGQFGPAGGAGCAEQVFQVGNDSFGLVRGRGGGTVEPEQ